MGHTITICDLDNETMTRLEHEATGRGVNVESYAATVLRKSVGTHVTEPKESAAATIASLAGTWSEDEFREFCEAVAPFEQIDDALWK